MFQGDGPVEILGVDPDTPAAEKGIMTSDLVVGINGVDSRFMSHANSVYIIRFGQEKSGEDGHSDDENDENALLNEVDVVDLVLVHPVAPPVSTLQRKPSTYAASSSSNLAECSVASQKKVSKLGSTCFRFAVVT